MCARAGFTEHNVAAAQPLPGFMTHTRHRKQCRLAAAAEHVARAGAVAVGTHSSLLSSDRWHSFELCATAGARRQRLQQKIE